MDQVAPTEILHAVLKMEGHALSWPLITIGRNGARPSSTFILMLRNYQHGPGFNRLLT